MNNLLVYKGYLATIEFSPDDEVFFGKVHGINDLITFEGTDVKNLKAAFHHAIEDYLKTCKQLQKVADKTYKGVFNVRIDASLHRKASFVAKQHKMTLNEFVKTAINSALGGESNLQFA